jgi:hypothetical protein
MFTSLPAWASSASRSSAGTCASGGAALDVPLEFLAILAGGRGAAVEAGGGEAVAEAGGVAGGAVRPPDGGRAPQIGAPGRKLAVEMGMVGYIVLLVAALVASEGEPGLGARPGEALAVSLAKLVGHGEMALRFRDRGCAVRGPCLS